MAVTLIDETTRPKAPKIEGVTPAQRARGRHLALFHRMHLDQIDQIRSLIDQIEAGDPTAAGTLAATIPEMPMMRNYRMFGALCGQECQYLTFHHDAEERELFPMLKRAGDEGLRRVIDRLIEEHKVVHALLEELHEGVTEIMTSATRREYDRVRETFDTLERVIRSHFRYEETELQDAMGFYGVI